MHQTLGLCALNWASLFQQLVATHKLKYFFYIFANVFFCLCWACFVGPALSQTKTLGELSQLTGADRQSLLVAGAKKEGELSVYYAHPIIQTIVDAFSQNYGIKVKTWRAGSEALQQKVISEQRAGKFEIDVLSSTAIDTEALYKERLLRK